MQHLFVPKHIEDTLRAKGCNVREVEIIGFKGILWQQAADWLREEKGTIVNVGYFGQYWYSIEYLDKNDIVKDGVYHYEFYPALQSGIEKALELI